MPPPPTKHQLPPPPHHHFTSSPCHTHTHLGVGDAARVEHSIHVDLSRVLEGGHGVRTLMDLL